MAKEKVAELQASEIKIGTQQAVESINKLKAAVKDSTNEWKVMESQMKQSGDAVGASEAKYKGLTQSVAKQENMLQKLRQEQSEVNRSTEAGEQTYQKYATQITTAERQLASMTRQQEQAKRAYEMQESGIASLNKEIRQNIQETDAHVDRLKAEGKESEALEAQHKGLSTTISKQSELYQKQSKMLDEMVKSGTASTGEITKQRIALDKTGESLAKNKNALTENELASAKHSSGIEKLNKQIQENDELTKVQTDRLDAEGDKTKAVTRAKEGLSTKIKLMNELYEKQAHHLKTLENAEGDNASAISKQRLALEKTKTAISQAEHNMNGLGKTSEKTSSTFKEVFKGTALAQAGIQAIQSVKGALEGAVEAGGEYNKEQDTMRTVWHSLTTEAPRDGKELIGFINDMSSASIYSADSINEMAQSFYHVHSNAKETKEWTQDFVNLGSTMHLTDAQIAESGKTFAKIMAGGKAGAEDLNMMIDRFPMFGEALEKTTGKSMQQIRQMSSQGKLTSDMFGEAMDSLGKKYAGGQQEAMTSFQGMTMYLTKRRAQLFGDIEKSSFNMSKSMKANILSITSDKSMTQYANAISKAIGQVMSVIAKIMTYIADHRKDIMSVISNLSKITGILGGAIWHTIKGTVLGIAGAIGSIGGSAKKTHDPLKTLNNALQAILKHKGAIKAFGATLVGAFAMKKLLNFSKSAVDTAKNIGDMGKSLIGLAKSEKTAAAAQKALNFVMSINPFGAILLGITALVAGFTLLYKHNKKFKKFVDGLVSAAADFAKGILKWFGKAWSNISSFFKKVINFVKKDWKEILLYIVNPFAGAFALIYKHNAKFRKAINSLVKTVINYFKNMAKNISNIFNDIKSFIAKTLSSIGKTWNKAWKSISDFFNKVWTAIKKTLSNVLNTIKKTLVSSLNAYIKLWSTAWKSISKTFSNIWNGIKKFLRSMLSWLRNAIEDAMDFVYKIWHKGWNKISSFFSNIWKSMKRTGHDAIWSLKNTFDSVLGKIHKAFSNTWKGIKSGFSDMWDGMKTLAGKGINAVIKIPNTGISGINGLIHDFGGPKHAISKIPSVKFATGTGMFSNVRKAITKPTLALLNDGNDSPETGNQETLIHPNGAMELVQGRNTKRLLAPGTEVLNASETAMMLGMQAMPFKSGTGFWSGIFDKVTNVAGNAWSGLKNGVKKFTEMFKFITNAVAHPVKTLQDKFNPSAKGLAGMFDSFGTAMFKKPKEQAKDWWKTLWSMANDASNAGADGGMKGDDYRYKGKGADSGADPWGYFFKECVSFVASRLANSGVSASKFSHLGNGSDWVNAPVPHMSKPKVGSVAVYSAGSEFGNHVAMVTGVQGNKISGEEYNWNYNHKYHQYHNRNASGATTFLDFGLRDNSKPADVKANSALEKLIKKQTGGMLGWIQKFIAPLNDSESGGVGGDVQSWSGDVKKALSKLGLSTAPDMVQRVLRQIDTESKGNPKAVQGYIPGDPNNAPQNRARGLMQVVPSTFNANALPGHHDIFNGYDNILAGLNYARKRYGDSLSWLGHGQGYERGGLVSTHGLYEIAEKNKPEMIIPLAGDNVRANQLLDEASLRINGKKNSDDSLIEKLLAKQDGGDTYEININVNADVTPNAIKKIQQAVEDAITRKQNAKSRAFG